MASGGWAFLAGSAVSAAGAVVAASIYRFEGVVVEYSSCMAACHRISLSWAISPLTRG